MAQKLRFGTRERIEVRNNVRVRRTPSAYNDLIHRCTEQAIAHGLIAHRAQLRRIKANAKWRA